MTIQPSIGDVRSTPTAINATAYPTDFLKVKYWGVAAGGSFVATGGTNALLTANAPPDVTAPLPGGLPVLRTGDPAQSFDKTGIADGNHIIRQLVYFGRSEPGLSSRAVVDDTDTAFTSTGAWASVGDTTAANGSYLHVGPTNGPASAQAVWLLKAPSGGNYFLTVHLPKTVSASEQRIPDAEYTVSYGPGPVIKTVRVSQVNGTGANSTVLLPTGPIPLAAGQTVTVTLDNTTAVAPLAVTPPYEVVADSMTMATSPEPEPSIAWTASPVRSSGAMKPRRRYAARPRLFIHPRRLQKLMF